MFSKRYALVYEDAVRLLLLLLLLLLLMMMMMLVVVLFHSAFHRPIRMFLRSLHTRHCAIGDIAIFREPLLTLDVSFVLDAPRSPCVYIIREIFV